MVMRVTLQYFDGCPNWQITDAHLRRLSGEHEFEVHHELIDSIERAEEAEFRGSPTVLIEGVDPFAEREAPIGLACRIYQTDDGPSGSPTRRQLQDAIVSAIEGDRW